MLGPTLGSRLGATLGSKLGYILGNSLGNSLGIELGKLEDDGLQEESSIGTLEECQEPEVVGTKEGVSEFCDGNEDG